ncbi:nitroreductase family protein [Dysgonomonas sp. 25]|uniref:nitroreductase family protein n=1 Tax=Dysgonomonas sp. 25 TaxID=2302933 RepID=UPI0013D59F37|nr:nitroreductase family protein [Dysgonomonas sp. 25]NDV68910.1 nitroreductase [Dysgonomonas sp. 25]
MKLLKLIENRYSVRNYLPKAVEDEKLNYILECARLAPSACNKQPWFFYVVTDENTKKAIAGSYDRPWVQNVPVFIVVCKDSEASWKRADGKDSGDIDAAITAEHICLAADETGLGTCWICNFDLERLTKALAIPANMEAIAIFPIGYVDEEKSKKPQKNRKALDEITKWI